MPPAVLAIATMDTKGEEIAFVADCLRSAGIEVKTVDVGTAAAPTREPNISRETVAQRHPKGSAFALGHTDRGAALEAMAEALRQYVVSEALADNVLGVVGIGGSGGTALIAPAMQALPIGVPKLMVSTVASGNVAPYVGCSDILMMYSVVDVAGINAVSSRILANAASAMAGMVTQSPRAAPAKPTIGMTMFGVTTPCVTAVRQALENEGFDCLVFHATGTGGRAMEKLVESGMIVGVLDITTTEVADQVVGGVFPAGAERFDVILRRGIPYVMSLGALDMVNFGAAETVPSQFRGRKLHIHNSQVTLMRTTAEENRSFAGWIAAKLRLATAPVAALIPEGGVSALDAPGQPFHDPQADAALIDELITATRDIANVRLERLPWHINSMEFSKALTQSFLSAWRERAGASIQTT